MRLVDSHCHLNADRFEPTPTRSSRPLGPPASSGSSSRAGTSPRRNGRSRSQSAHPWLDAAVGIHPHDAAKVDEAGWDRVVALGGRSTGRGDRRDRARLRPRLQPDPGPAGEPAPEPAPRARDRQAGHPALPVRGRPARRAGRARRRAAHGRGRRTGLDGAVRRAPAGRHPLVLRPGRLRRTRCIDLGLAISFSGLVFRRGEEASATVAAVRAGRSAARRDRFAVPGPTGRAALAQRARVGARHSGVGRGATRHDARRPRPAADRRLRPRRFDATRGRHDPRDPPPPRHASVSLGHRCWLPAARPPRARARSRPRAFRRRRRPPRARPHRRALPRPSAPTASPDASPSAAACALTARPARCRPTGSPT